MTKNLELTVSYPFSLYPYEVETTVLIEYQEVEEGEEIEGIFVSELVPEKLIEYVKEQAKEKFFNQEGSI